jgi:hypothetical protein
MVLVEVLTQTGTDRHKYISALRGLQAEASVSITAAACFPGTLLLLQLAEQSPE